MIGLRQPKKTGNFKVINLNKNYICKSLRFTVRMSVPAKYWFRVVFNTPYIGGCVNFLIPPPI